MATPRGGFVWHELMTTDPDAAIRFYSKVIGWQVEAWKGDPTYRIWTAGGAPMGGLMRLPEEARRMSAPPSWLTYVFTPDVDATVRRATSLGGRVLAAARNLPDVGRFAVLADPQGAAFSVYKPAREQSGVKQGTPGEFSWHELATTDYRAAWNFYRALFGWEATEALDLGPAGTYWMFRSAGQGRGGIYNKPPEMPVANWLPYILVRNADQTAETAKRLGARILMGPMDVPTGDRIAAGIDPQGAAFAVYALPVKPAARAAPKRRPAKRPQAKKKATAKKKPAKKKARKAKRRR